eukprot:scaffold1087_cov198-Pinguiococcus_pyrenoidosus.AAC.15
MNGLSTGIGSSQGWVERISPSKSRAVAARWSKRNLKYLNNLSAESCNLASAPSSYGRAPRSAENDFLASAALQPMGAIGTCRPSHLACRAQAGRVPQPWSRVDRPLDEVRVVPQRHLLCRDEAGGPLARQDGLELPPGRLFVGVAPSQRDHQGRRGVHVDVGRLVGRHCPADGLDQVLTQKVQASLLEGLEVTGFLACEKIGETRGTKHSVVRSSSRLFFLWRLSCYIGAPIPE